jgi:hypothetical protein
MLALCLLQSGVVLSKTHQLRQVKPGIWEAIEYLEEHPPDPGRVFMYPEGNYRFFPVRQTWYLNFTLRDFWQDDNDGRLARLHEHGVGAIVVKKYLVGRLDEEMNRLGVYPVSFVKDIEGDPRFRKVFENEDVKIFNLPLAVEQEKGR